MRSEADEKQEELARLDVDSLIKLRAALSKRMDETLGRIADVAGKLNAPSKSGDGMDRSAASRSSMRVGPRSA